MSGVLVILAFVAALALMVLKALAVDQVKGQIQRRIRAHLNATIADLPEALQARWAEEWHADLAKDISMPLTAIRFVLGVRRSAHELAADAATTADADNPVPAASVLPHGSRMVQTWTIPVSQPVVTKLTRIVNRHTSPGVNLTVDVVGIAVVSATVSILAAGNTLAGASAGVLVGLVCGARAVARRR